MPRSISGVSERILTFSSTVTRLSVRRRWSSCPCPTSTAYTCAAPPWRRQSVNPPVDAPASSTRLPSGLTANRVSAAANFSPPRLTNGAGGPCTTTGSSRATRRAALSAWVPATSTNPAAIAFWASCRLATRPRRTSSVSSRRRDPGLSCLPSWRREPSWRPSSCRQPTCRRRSPSSSALSWPPGTS